MTYECICKLFDILVLVHGHEQDKDLHKVLNLCHCIYFCVTGTNKMSTNQNKNNLMNRNKKSMIILLLFPNRVRVFTVAKLCAKYWDLH
jgi:hypothetical protein